MSLEIQLKTGLQIKNSDHSGFLLQSLLLGCIKTSAKKEPCMFFLAQFLVWLPRWFKRIIGPILRKYIMLCFSKCKKDKKLNFEKSISQDILGQYYLTFSNFKGYINYSKKYTMTNHV